MQTSVVIVKPGGTGQADAGHFREVGALAAEERLHGAVAVRAAVAEVVDVFAGLVLDGSRSRRFHLGRDRSGRLLRRGAAGGGGFEGGTGFHPGGLHRLGGDQLAVRTGGLLADSLDGERGTFRGRVARRRGGLDGAGLQSFDRGSRRAAGGFGFGWLWKVGVEGQRNRRLRGGILTLSAPAPVSTPLPTGAPCGLIKGS